MESEDQFIICSTCGSSNAAAGRFCNNCGAPLGVPPSAYADTITAARQDSATLDVTTHDQLTGRVIDGRYRIDSLIGIGGMGSVYRATRVVIGDEVAVKILHTERVADPHTPERFRREAQAAARLKHPNAVSIYDFGVSGDGLQYLVMELLEGESLRQIIKQQGTVEPSLAAEITAQTCAALDEAHRHHIVHRDIKPDNIIVNSTPAGLRVKVLDFGIAKLRDDAASHLTQTGSVMGTPHYMSPEQCLGEELDARADIYSMGIVLYEMLCGRVPFNSPISTAVVVQHVNQPPPPLRSFNADISPQVESAVLHALQKARDARPLTAGTFARTFSAAAQQSSETTIDVPAAWPVVPLEPSSPIHPARITAPPPLASEMSPTVHLASLSGPTAQVPQARATGGNGTASLGINKAPNFKYVVGGATLGLLILVTIVGLIFWRALSDKSQTDSEVAGESGEMTTRATAGNPPPRMVYVPGGTFMMGSPNSIEDQDSKPAHSVSVKPFFLDIYEVTSAEYKKCVDAKKCNAASGWPNGVYPPGAGDHPVTGVSWEEANAYAKWAGKRLPTEEEWEFAARGQGGLLYPWGNDWKVGCANADNAKQGMTDVGNHRCESPYGALDLIGNAWEWTSSNWTPYPNGQLSDAGKGGEKVIRGGSWLSPRSVTTSFRLGFAGPGKQTGFRCARNVDQ
ncbi:MAG TPA: SUMF1/EgtB/PvdO family nonheme iron enzyme [Pyrinomonadaceae bacterium]